MLNAMVNNTAVGLVADDPSKVVQRFLAAVQHGLQAARHSFHRKTENCLAVHRDRRGVAGRRAEAYSSFNLMRRCRWQRREVIIPRIRQSAVIQ